MSEEQNEKEKEQSDKEKEQNESKERLPKVYAFSDAKVRKTIEVVRKVLNDARWFEMKGTDDLALVALAIIMATLEALKLPESLLAYQRERIAKHGIEYDETAIFGENPDNIDPLLN